MKIIYYSPHPTHDIVSEVGYSIHQRETINAFRENGHEVFPVIMGGTESESVARYHDIITRENSFKKWFRIMVPLILRNSLKDLRLLKHDKKAVKRLAEAIRDFQPDLVYERNEYMQDGGTLYCKRKGVLHFLEVNSPVVEEMKGFEGPSFFHLMGHRKEKNKFRNTSRIFVVSSALKSFLEGRYGVKKPIVIIPNCINPSREITDPEKVQKLRSELKTGNRKVIGFIGSIFPYHGVDRLIKAFSDLSGERDDLFLLVVGGGSYKDALEKEAHKMLRTDSFRFTGKVPHSEALNYIELFDIAVMPDSNWYGSPVKILEYGWLGKPIVAPDYAPLRDLIVPESEGILIKKDENALQQAIRFLIDNPQKAMEMASKFKQKIAENYTWRQQAARISGYCVPRMEFPVFNN